jgi:DNA modification methylase
MEELKWHTEIRKISELKEWEDNPRIISDKAYKRLVKSIKERGFHDIIKIDENNVVLSGNQRLKALKELGYKEIECKVCDEILNQDQKDAVAVESNMQDGEWDMDKLAEGFGDVMEEIGYGDLLPEVVPEVEEDDYEEPEDLETTVVLGGVYQLGEHRLMCGDSTKIEDVEKLVGEEKIKCVFTSPPYNMGADLYKHYSDNKKSEEYIQFNLDVVNGWKKWLDGYLFWNISYNKNSRWEFLEIMYRIARETGLKFLELIVWDKKTAMPITSKKQMTRTYEDILVVADENNMRNDFEMFGVSTNRSDVYFNKRTGRTMTNYWRVRPGNTQIKGLHEACYPLELPARAIDLVTKGGEVVADPFGGSGSTLIACEQTNRRCYMMEIDPHYCQVIIDRWEKYTNKEAKKL